MFYGEYSHSIDAKGRTIVPSKLREALGDHFMITKGMDGCLMAYDMTAWEEFAVKLKELPTMTNKNARQFARHFGGSAVELECDSQGRVLIPANLRSFAGMSKEAVFLGLGDRIEIWSKEKYETDATSEDMDEIAAALEAVGISI